jgi:aminoglycoside 6-adenylyltransferase
LYAKHVLGFVREQLMNMLTWYVGMKTQFSCDLGKFGKYLKQYLEPDLWDMLEKTYADAGYAATWEALDTMCNLFRITAARVAEHFGFEYPDGDDEKVSAHLQHVRFLPKNAKEMY